MVEKPDIIDDELEASAAPLLSHLTELRARLLKCLLVLALGFALCIGFAAHIFDLLLYPYEKAAGGL